MLGDADAGESWPAVKAGLLFRHKDGANIVISCLFALSCASALLSLLDTLMGSFPLLTLH